MKEKRRICDGAIIPTDPSLFPYHLPLCRKSGLIPYEMDENGHFLCPTACVIAQQESKNEAPNTTPQEH